MLFKKLLKLESLSNMKDSVDAENPQATTSFTPTETQAILDSEKAEKQLEEVNKELELRAEQIKEENPTAPNPKIENAFTAKVNLEEDLEDFNVAEKTSKPVKVFEEDDIDYFLDYDMYHFIYGLFVSQAEYPPKIPKELYSGRVNKFLYQGSDDYIGGDNGMKGVCQVGSDGDNVVLYSDKKEDFDSVMKVCDLFHLKYKGPTEKRSAASRWNWSLTIITPVTASGYPEMLEDYMDKIGFTIEDVMSKDFVKNYRSRQEKENEAKNMLLCDKTIHKIVSRYAKEVSPESTVQEKKDIQTRMLKELANSKLEFMDGEMHPLIYSESKAKTLFNKLVKEFLHSA